MIEISEDVLNPNRHLLGPNEDYWSPGLAQETRIDPQSRNSITILAGDPKPNYLEWSAAAPRSRGCATMDGERSTVLSQLLPGRADIGIAFLVIGEAGAREGPIGC